MTIRITGDGPKITATGSGSTVLVEISTGQHDPGSFSGVHNDLTGRSTTGAHVGTAVSIDPSGFAGNLDGTITNAQLLAAAVDDLTTGGGGGVTGDSELVATSTTLTGPPHTIAVAAAGSIDITVTLPDATAGDKGLVWYIRNLNSDSVVYVANLAEGDETITESKGLLVSGIETDTPGTYAWMKVGFVSDTAAAGGGASLSDTTPQALGTAAAGDGTAAARDDHVHAMPTAADVGAAATSHSHAGTDITSGLIAASILGSGGAGAGAKFLADDQTFKTPPSVGAVLGDVVLTSAQAVVSFASIPATYAHLVVAYQVRSSSAGVATVRLQMRVNNDSGSNYNSQLVAGNNTTAAAQVQSGADHGYLGNVPAANATAGQSGSGSIEIPNYAGTTFWKNAIYQTTRDENSAGANMVHYRGHVVWRSTAAINRVDLFFFYGDFIAGSRITLYGVSGA